MALRALTLAFTHRFIVLTLCVLAAIALAIVIGSAALKRWDVPLSLALLIFAGLSILGVRDLLQTRHSILRNYPIAAHLRFLLEEIRPEIRQYFFESEKDGLPFPRDRRAVVYQRAKLGTSGPSARSSTFTRRATNGFSIRSPPGRSPPRPFASALAGPIVCDPTRFPSSTFPR
jgi:hypothetical protein